MIIIKIMLIKFKNDIIYHCNDILSEHTKLSNKLFCDSVTVKLKSENNFLNERFTIKFKVSFLGGWLLVFLRQDLIWQINFK